MWSLNLGPVGMGAKVFFLSCPLVAGLYGAAMAGWKVLLVQALPVAIGLALVCLS